MTPVFAFTDHFDTTVTIFGRDVPIKIKRYSRAESDSLWARSQAFDPRGATPPEPDAPQTLAFFEEVITSSITLDEDVITDRGHSVTTGAGLIDLFFNRQDVLAALAAQVIIENRLMPSLAKNSNSLRGTDTGSALSSPAPSEPSSDLIVESAAPSSSAAVSAVTEPAAAAAASSGATNEATAVE